MANIEENDFGPGPAAVERVIDQASAKPFKVRATLARLEHGAFDASGAQLHVENPVPIHDSSYSTTIGFATVVLQDGHLVADLFLDYATPERLSIETGSTKLYARALGGVTCSGPRVIFLHDFSPNYKMLIENLYVGGVVLTEKTPADEGLQPLSTT